MIKFFITIFGILGLLSTPSTWAQIEPHPCTLVTTDELKEAVGADVTGGTVNPNNKSVCDYKVGTMGSILNISLTRKGAADSAKKMVDELQKRKIKSELVNGLGDGAYASSPGYGMQQLGVYKGHQHIIVTGLLAGTPELKVKAILEKVMRKAITRLK